LEEPMETVPLGSGGPQVSRAGLGLLGMSGIYGRADDNESIVTIRAALDAGITLLDTGDFYGSGHNEMLLRDALRGVPRDSVFIQVKFGGQRDPRGAFIGHDTSPVMAKNSLAYSLQRLGTDYVDLYQPSRLDPRVPIEDTVGAIAEMIEAGYVRHLGLSEVGAADRVLADEPGNRGADPADGPRAGHRGDRVRGDVARPAVHRECA
jgi:aryl-alcohol dehydrogenase-like predicted oxidoreductase